MAQFLPVDGLEAEIDRLELAEQEVHLERVREDLVDRVPAVVHVVDAHADPRRSHATEEPVELAAEIHGRRRLVEDHRHAVGSLEEALVGRQLGQVGVE